MELLLDQATWRTLRRLHAEQSAPHPPSLDAVNRQLRREGVGPDMAAALVTQLELRAAARAKFGDLASDMVFTREGLEQATRLPVAKLHAERFRAAGVHRVADLGCGVGADSLALALLGVGTVSVDADPAAVFCAAKNLAPYPGARTHRGDVTQLTAQDVRGWGADGLFLDPARRGPRGRQFDPARWSPPWDTIMGMTTWGLPLGAKVAPGIDHPILPPLYHAQWLSVSGALVEAALWSPELAPEGPGRSAALLSADALPDSSPTPPPVHVLTDPQVKAANAPIRPAPTGPVGEYLFEADPSATRAGLLAALAENTGTHLVDPSIAYLTGPHPVPSPFLTAFRTFEVLPLRTKAIRQALGQLDAGWVEVKKRGANIDTAALQKQLQSDGPNPLVVFATRVDGRHRAIIATRETSLSGEQQ